MRMGAILNGDEAVPLGDGHDGIHISHLGAEVDGDDGFGAFGDGSFDGGCGDESERAGLAAFVELDDAGLDAQHVGCRVALFVGCERHRGAAVGEGLASGSVGDVEGDDGVGAEPVVGEVFDGGGGKSVVGASGEWGRRNFARWMFEDEPRAIATSPRRWHRRFLHGSIGGIAEGNDQHA